MDFISFWILALSCLIQSVNGYVNETFSDADINTTDDSDFLSGGLLFNSTNHQHDNDDPQSCYCNLVINEINTDSPFSAPSLFIELMRVFTANKKHRRKPSNVLVDQFVVIVRASPLAVVFYADLTNEMLRQRDESQFLVIGDPGLPELALSGISLSNPGIASIYKNSDQARLLPNGDTSPFAVLLLYAPNRRRDVIWMKPQIDFEGNYKEVTFPASDIHRFRDLIKDMVVYGRKTPVTSCDVFDNLWPDTFEKEEGKTYILRDWDVQNKPDYSINRCSSNSLPFQIQSFQYDKPSPGRRNPCEGVSFTVENAIDKLAPLQGNNENDVEMCAAENVGIPSGRYPLIDEQALETYRDSSMPSKCDPCSSGSTSTVQEAMNLAIKNGGILKLGGDPVPVVIKSVTDFKQEMIELATPYLPDNGAIIKQKDIQQWLRVKEVKDGTRPITFQCSVCMVLFGDKEADVKMREHITTHLGYFSTNIHKNANKIRKHASSVTHKDAVTMSYAVASAKSSDDQQRLYKEYEDNFNQNLLPTVRMVRTVFAETLSEVPFMYHPVFVDLQEANGVNLGYHHYSDHSAGIIMDVISKTMHETLLQRLVEQDMPFSLIVDATTSTRNVPFLIIYIQTTEDGYPVTYYYRNVDLPDGETAQKTFDAFWDAVCKDDETVPGFKEYVKKRLTFFVSDNASVMIGKNKSFLVLLKEKLERDINNIGCMAHKTSLVLKAALHDKSEDKLLFVHWFESSLNDLYVFYMSRGSKCFQHLVETAHRFGLHLKRFKKNIEVRWAAGEFGCISAILNNMKALRKDLHDIEHDHSFTNNARLSAHNIYKVHVDIKQMLIYHEFYDLLEINKILSEKLQERSGLLLDHYSTITRCIQDYEKLKTSPGRSLTKFINGCRCENVCALGTCTLSQVEVCPQLVCDDNVEMIHFIVEDIKLSDARPIIYTKLIEAFRKYFSLDLIEALVVLDNREFNTQLTDDEKKNHFNFVCDFLKYHITDCELIGGHYFALVEVIKSIPTYTENFQHAPSLFWPMVLHNEGDLLVIPHELRGFLNVLLVLSDSSAEAERGFSVLARIDAGARSNLQPQTLDGLLRIKLNANKPVSQIDAFLYAKKFTENHHRVDDRTGGKVKKSMDKIYQPRHFRYF